jgi:hypothetical protein
MSIASIKIEFEQEHQFVLERINNLRAHCHQTDCSNCCNTHAECLSHVVNELGEIFFGVYEHFMRQEKLIKNNKLYEIHKEHCDGHIEAHAEITEKIQNLISDIPKLSASEIISKLSHDIYFALHHHAERHDEHLHSLISAPKGI